MEIIEQIYQDLVNRNPDISIRYHRYRDQVHGVSRVKAWGYLIKMNIEYRLLKQKVSAGEDLFYKEKQVRSGFARPYLLRMNILFFKQQLPSS